MIGKKKVTLVVQNGTIVQLEKNEKVRLKMTGVKEC